MCNLNRILLCLILAVAGTSVIQATEPPESFILQVVLRDPSDQPIDDASVNLVGLEQRPSIAHQTPGAISIEHQGDGLYQATVSISDQRLLSHNQSLLVVRALGRSLHTEQLRFARIVTGVPLRVTLPAAEQRTVRVVDSAGQPVPDAVVRPAVWDRTVVPLFEELPKSVATGADGKTSATWLDPARLSMVYVQAESIGNQRVPIAASVDGMIEVVTMPTFDIQGRWSSPMEMADHPDFFETAIVVRPSVSAARIDGQTTMAYSWSETKPRPNGTLEPVRVSEGNAVVAMNLPHSLPLVTKMETIEVSSNESIELKLFEGIRVRGKVIEESTNKPLSGIKIRQFTFCRDEPLTADDGTFELWFHPDDRISFFPDDATGRRMSADGFYHYPVELPVDGKLDLKPTPLVSMPECIGTVVNSEGKPVAGATVIGQFKNERFNNTAFLYSDANGNFPFFGVQPGATIELTAMAAGMMSAKPVSLTLSPEANPQVSVEPRHAVRVRGTVVDRQSKPIASASVLLRTAYVSQEESYGGEDTSAMALTEPVDPIVTDTKGEFVSSPILDWQRRFSLEIAAPGYRTLRNYWTDGSKAGKAKSDLDFGTLVMLPDWPEVTQSIQIIDSETGKPLPDARVVCRGAYVDQQRATSDDEGRVEFKLRDSTAVFAADGDGYHPAFQVRRGGGALDKISLVPDHLPAPVRKGVSFDRNQKVEMAKQLIRRVDKPTPLDTPHRVMNYFRSLGFADFDSMLADAKVIAALPNMKSAVSSEMINAKGLTAEQTEAIQDLITDEFKFYWLMQRADNTLSTDEQLDLLGEAMVSVEQQSGDMALFNIGRLAIKLLRIGEQETAEQLLVDGYRDHSKLQRILDEGKREKTAGVARIFLPVYAIVDPQRAMELIRLTAFADEVPRLQTMAIRFAVEYAGKNATELAKTAGLEKLDSWGLVDHYVNVEHRDVDRAMAIADLCDDDSTKADFYRNLLSSSNTNRKTKAQLARRALEVFKNDDQRRGGLIAGHWLLQHADEVAAWDPRLAEDYRFEALWAQTESTLITPFSHVSKVAQYFATTDIEVARALIEPCFDDWSWLFGQRDGEVMFSNNNPLHAAAAMDHAWTISLVDDLFKQHLHNQPSRKLQTISGIIRSLREQP